MNPIFYLIGSVIVVAIMLMRGHNKNMRRLDDDYYKGDKYYERDKAEKYNH